MSSPSPDILTPPAPSAALSAALTPQDLGVGARFTVAVMDGDFAAILLAALADADATGLEVETDPVSTLVRGSEQRVLEYIAAVIAGAARGGQHVTASLLLSRGCPGEVTCSTTPGLLAEAAPVPVLAPTGIRASAHWSLYPLDDTGRPGEAPDHLRDIYAAIDHAKELGTYVRGEHYATLLEGDLADVLGTVAAGWVLVGRSVQHVTSHATLSIASPTAAAGTSKEA
ncbi:YkoF family thiamine/hydroxymethylpyrimidine-binding protein [Herbiconiux sp. YIM B11900]|uniref:YkoF family thiamine/hydroxymethylpyrimidine-binding protein n=1 Tax=Herbiconiux sp. YIM B11900 TaxID=3404131 RepID=UPI003F870DAD